MMLYKVKIPSLFAFLYAIVLIVELYAIFMKDTAMETIIKPFLTVVLLIAYIKQAKKINYVYLLILFLSFVDDGFFIYRESIHYAFRVVIFTLITIHLLYIYILYKQVKRNYLRKLVVYFIPFLLILGFLFLMVSSRLGSLSYILMIHFFILLTTVNLAFVNHLSIHTKGSFQLFLGMFLYIIADCFYVLYEFYLKAEIFVLLIVLIYSISQFLICNAMIFRSLREKAKRIAKKNNS